MHDARMADQGLLRRLARRVRSGLAPQCALCGLRAAQATVQMCADCEGEFFSSAVPRCRQCASRLPCGQDLCGRCLRQRPPHDATIALADYAPPVDGMIVGLKFGHRLDIAAVFGDLLAARLRAGFAAPVLLVPVPLAFERQAERGFNQAEQIARRVAVSGRWQLLGDALLRVRHGPPQEQLSAEERRRNVRGSFAVASHRQASVAGASVVVIDDVMTSGATLDETARVLKRAGAAHVTNAVVARTR